MFDRNRFGMRRASSPVPHFSSGSRSRQRLRRACISALPQVGPFEALESRTLFTIVQPAGLDYLAFEAEHAEATFTDLDGDGKQWSISRGNDAVGMSTLPSGGAAIRANRDTAVTDNNEGQVTYPIQLTTAGPYFFYARVKYNNSGGDNSIYLPPDGGPVNGAPTPQWDNRADSPGNYHWNALDNTGAAFDYTNPSPGAPTTLSINIREQNYYIDKIVLSQTAKTNAELDAILGQTLAAVAGPQANQVTVQFTPVAGAGSYNILRGTSAAGPFAPVGTASGVLTSFRDTSLPAGSAGQTFYYVVQPVVAGAPGAQAGPAPIVIDQGLRASYYNDAFWGSGTRASVRSVLEVFRPGAPDVSTSVGNVDVDWGDGNGSPGSPITGVIRPDNHSTLHTGRVTIPDDPADGVGGPVTVTFINSTDDDGALFINGVRVAEDMGPPGHGQRDITGTIDLVQGQSYSLAQFQAEQGGGSGVRIRWVNPLTNITEAIPPQYLSIAMPAPAAPALSAPVIADPAAGGQRMVSFTLRDNSTSELWFDLLRDGVVVASSGLNFNDLDSDPLNGNQAAIADSQPIPGTHSYQVRAVNFDGSSALSPAVSVTVPANYYADPANGASAYYFNSASWSGGRVGSGLTGGPDIVLAGNPDYGETVARVDIDYGTTANTPNPSISDDYFGTVHTGELLVPDDGDATPGETFAVQFVGNTDDHGVYFVNGQLAAISFIPRGQGDYTGAGPVSLVEGQRYDFVAMQVEQGGGAGVHLKWVNPVTGATEAVPSENLFPRTGAPAAPTGVSGLGTVNFINLAYTDAATNEVRYEIERAEVVGGVPGAYSLISYGAINSSGFVDRTAEPNKTYRYRISAVNYEGRATVETGNLGRPNDEAIPAAVTNLAAYALFNRGYLTFTDNATFETGFIIERKLATDPDSAYVQVPGSPLPGNAPNVTGAIEFYDNDPTFNPALTYTYRVSTVNVEGERSTPAVATTTLAGLKATIVDPTGPWGAKHFYDNPGYPTAAAGALDPLVRGDPNVNFVFDALPGTGPDPRMSGDTFAVNWEGYVQIDTAGDYNFFGESDDGIRIFIDGQMVVDAWIDRGPTETSSAEPPSTGPGDAGGIGGPVTLTAGKHEIRVLYYEWGGGAMARVRYEGPGVPKQVIPTNKLTPTDAANPLRAPINVTTSTGVGNTIKVEWIDNSAAETGYQVQRSTSPDTGFVTIATVPASQSGYLDGGATDTALTYYYKVVAVGAGGATQASAATAGVSPAAAVGGPVNFTDFSSTDTQALWQLNGDGPQFFDADGDPAATTERLRLTNAANDLEGSAFLLTPHDISKGFSTSFDFVAGGAGNQSGNPADGFTFNIQANAPTTFNGGGGSLAAAFGNSIAVKFDFYPAPLNQTGLYINGAGISDAPTDPFNRVVPLDFDFNSGTPLRATFSYNANTKVLTQTIDDIGNAATAAFETTYIVDIPEALGSSAAYVGFTAATGGENATQDILNFAFTPQGPVSAPVSEVYVRGQSWLGDDGAATVTFGEFMQSSGLGHVTYGYKLPATPTNTDTVSWINADEIVLRFAGPVSGSGIPTPGQITVDGTRQDYTVTQVIPIDDRTFALRLDRPLGNIPGGGIDGDKIKLTVAGAGVGGANFTQVINVLQGDASRDALGRVNAADQGYVKARVNRTSNNPGTPPQTLYTVFADVNADGRVNAADQGAVKSRINDGMPAAAPAGELFSATRITEEVLA